MMSVFGGTGAMVRMLAVVSFMMPPKVILGRSWEDAVRLLVITPVKYDCWCMRRFSNLQGEAVPLGALLSTLGRVLHCFGYCRSLVRIQLPRPTKLLNL